MARQNVFGKRCVRVHLGRTVADEITVDARVVAVHVGDAFTAALHEVREALHRLLHVLDVRVVHELAELAHGLSCVNSDTDCAEDHGAYDGAIKLSIAPDIFLD